MASSDSIPSADIINLDTKRRALEEEAKVITDELTQPSINNGIRTKPMGIDTPLVDEEGYPRSDIDIYRARHLRKRLNEIRYDHKRIMSQIEANLMNTSSSATSTSTTLSKEQIHLDEETARRVKKPKPKFDKATGKWVVCNWDGTVAGVENGHLRSFENLNSKVDNVSKTNETNLNNTIVENLSSVRIDEGNQSTPQVELERIPFAKISEVVEGSPAAQGGLRLNDVIVQVGSVDFRNHRNLQAIAEVVNRAYSDRDMVNFVVLRPTAPDNQSRRLSVNVKPGKWFGNGILGCRIIKV